MMNDMSAYVCVVSVRVCLILQYMNIYTLKHIAVLLLRQVQCIELNSFCIQLNLYFMALRNQIPEYEKVFFSFAGLWCRRNEEETGSGLHRGQRQAIRL